MILVIKNHQYHKLKDVIILTDTKKLKAAIKESGLKYDFIAKTLGLTYQGLKNKIENVREFKASEIICLCDILNISQQRDEIFFANYVD